MPMRGPASVMTVTEYVYGVHAVTSVLNKNPGSVTALWVDRDRNDRRSGELLELAVKQGVAARRVPSDLLGEKSQGARHQGVMAQIDGNVSRDSDWLFNMLETLAGPPFLLVLDGVTDPHNLGACLRSADAAGVHAVIVPKDRAAGMTPVVRKVASGAAEHLPLVQVTNLARTLTELRSLGVWLIGTDDDADCSLYGIDLTGPLALVMGAEGKGMRRLTRESCDRLVSIPMAGVVSSLNVSVATGVVLFEAIRQRGGGEAASVP